MFRNFSLPIAIGLMFTFNLVVAQRFDDIDVSLVSDGIFQDTVNGMIVRGEVIHGLKQGAWTSSFNTELVSLLVHYRDGHKDGLEMELDRNGVILSQSNYHNDTLNGTRLVFSGGGHPRLNEPYKMGKLNGTRKVFYEKGKMQEKSDYLNGVKNGKSIWYDEDGKMIAEYNYKDGLFDGPQLVFYPNGNIKSEQWYFENMLQGKNILFHENGKIKNQGEYKMGKKSGMWKSFDESGKLTQEINFN